jgi:hypothetical protein
MISLPCYWRTENRRVENVKSLNGYQTCIETRRERETEFRMQAKEIGSPTEDKNDGMIESLIDILEETGNFLSFKN